MVFVLPETSPQLIAPTLFFLSKGGHGFKFASVVGETLADLAEFGESSRFDLSLFSIGRRRAAVPG